MSHEEPIAVLLVDGKDGRIVHANAEATELLSSTRGFRCWNLVRGRTPCGDEVCATGCVQRLIDAHAGSCERDDVIVRGKPVRLVCTPHDRLVVVSVVPRPRA